jgi:hypothetical protein
MACYLILREGLGQIKAGGSHSLECISCPFDSLEASLDILANILCLLIQIPENEV